MKKLSLYAAALMLATGVSAAHASNFYIGGDVGQSTFKDAPDGWDDSDVAYKVYLGLTTSDIVDFRVGYTNLGKTSITDGYGSGELKSQGAFVDALFKYKPTSELSLFGKLGASYLQNKYSESHLESYYGYYNSYSYNSGTSNNLYFVPGVGLNYGINSSLGVTAEYEYYLHVGDNSTTYKTDISVLSLGVYFHL